MFVSKTVPGNDKDDHVVSRRSKYVRAFLLAIIVGGAGLALYTAQSGAATGPLLPATGLNRAIQPSQKAVEIAQAATSLPGGASALNETYEDWQVTCAQRAEAMRCAMSQTQIQQNGQRVLAIEFSAPVTGSVEGILALPFGLALEHGAILSIDDQSLPPALRFRTCLPAGCILPMTFDAATLKALKAGAVLKVATISDGNQEQAFSISLKGFAAALDRLGGLMK